MPRGNYCHHGAEGEKKINKKKQKTKTNYTVKMTNVSHSLEFLNGKLSVVKYEV